MSATQAYVKRNGQATVVAAGTLQSDAAALTKQFNIVTGADDAAGVILPIPKLGESVGPVLVYNSEAAATLLIYPQVGGTIDSAADDAAVELAADSFVILWPTSTTQWRGYNPPAAAFASVTPGTVAASKGVVVDANKDVSLFRNVGVTNLDAGASGTAGTVDVFPTTAAKGKLAITKADNTNNDTTTIAVAAQGQASTITVPDPGAATANFLLSEGAQSVVGAMTLANLIYKTASRTVTALGDGTGLIADSGLLQFITVTSDDAAKILTLPTPTPGTLLFIINGGTGYELRSSDPATVAINGGSGAAAESAIAASTLVVAVCKTATAWAAWSLVGTTLAAVEAAA